MKLFEKLLFVKKRKFLGWTDFEKWEYKEDKLDSAYYTVGLVGEIALGIATLALILFAVAIFI